MHLLALFHKQQNMTKKYIDYAHTVWWHISEHPWGDNFRVEVKSPQITPIKDSDLVLNINIPNVALS